VFVWCFLFLKKKTKFKACGIRDFRGPNGVWTRESNGLGLELLPGDVPFDEASPSLAHMAILGLIQSGKCKYVVSQNVDGLHLRSGLDSEKLSELHGNIFQVLKFFLFLVFSFTFLSFRRDVQNAITFSFVILMLEDAVSKRHLGFVSFVLLN
jgi:hypothetical protein